VSISNISGFIPLKKDRGLSSNQVIQRLKKRLDITKIGHCGTLDPIADGVLPVTVNKATRTMRYFLRYKKTYVATIRFGIETDTLDISGRVLSESDRLVGREAVEDALGEFRGGYVQKTPAFSARKYKGKSLYHYARRGVQVPDRHRVVDIDELVLTVFDFPFAEIRIVCGSGTYIRQLIVDICRRVDTVGTMYSLTRCEYGIFGLQGSKGVDELSISDVIPVSKVFTDFGRFGIRSTQLNLAKNGSGIDGSDCEFVDRGSADEFFGLFDGEPVGIYRMVDGVFRPEVMLIE